MAVRPVLIYPDPRLREVAKKVETIDQSVLDLIRDMYETMDAEDGAGLAATQIGVPLRILVLNVGKRDQPELKCFINPEIARGEGTVVHDEGCLSFPGIRVPVPRFEKVTITAMDETGKSFEIVDDSGDYYSIGHMLQHEIEHLEGRVFVDYLSPFKREWVLRKLEKVKRKAK
jgi:peptide deformylase